MPYTVNGVGTWYYGKRNLKQQEGICEFCHAQTKLSSYQTRLWFVFLFIPIVPLGRKQVLNSCPVCSRHRVASVKEWSRIGEEAIGKAWAKVKENPADAEATMELHATLVTFQRHEDAARYGDLMADEFADHAEVQLHLAVWHAQHGRTENADLCYARALEAEPENPFARRGVAIAAIEKGDLAKARQLLAFMESPGPNQDPAVLVLLAKAYQARGDHNEALGIFQTILRDHPGLARDRGLRKLVRASERALARHESILPAISWRRRPAAIWSGVALVAVAAVLSFSYYRSSHQTLHIVNGLRVPVNVSIDGGSEQSVAPGARTAVVVGEGKHQAVARRPDAAEERIEFDVTNGFFQRLTGDGVFVLNPGGAATLVRQEITYAKNPDPRRSNPYRLHTAQAFLVFRGIDYPFQDPPAQLKVEKSSGTVTKTHLDVLTVAPEAILAGFPEGTPPEELMRFAECHLALERTNENLLEMYFVAAARHQLLDRCRDYLEKGLANKPAFIPWHRTYQQICTMTGKEETLAPKYERMLSEEPRNSALLYLAGRICRDNKKAEQYFDRAIAADPQNPFPLYSKGYRRVSRGEYAEAKKLCAEACRLRPDAHDMAHSLFTVRMALREYEALEAELKTAKQAKPLASDVQQRLLEVLGASGKIEEAERTHREYVAKIQSASAMDPMQAALWSELTLRRVKGDIPGLVERARQLKDPLVSKSFNLLVLLQAGKPAEAESHFSSSLSYQAASDAMLLSIAWSRKGSAEKARHWRQQGIKQLKLGSHDEKKMAALLEKPDPRSLDEVDDLVIWPEEKAVLLVALADASKADRKELLERAEKLNIPAGLRYRFLQGVIDALKQ